MNGNDDDREMVTVERFGTDENTIVKQHLVNLFGSKYRKNEKIKIRDADKESNATVKSTYRKVSVFKRETMKRNGERKKKENL